MTIDKNGDEPSWRRDNQFFIHGNGRNTKRQPLRRLGDTARGKKKKRKDGRWGGRTEGQNRRRGGTAVPEEEVRVGSTAEPAEPSGRAGWTAGFIPAPGAD